MGRGSQDEKQTLVLLSFVNHFVFFADSNEKENVMQNSLEVLVLTTKIKMRTKTITLHFVVNSPDSL